MEIDDISAEFVQMGGVKRRRPERIPGDHRPHLARHAVLPRVAQERGADGALVINNPFWWSADDKFFNYALATKLGVAVPRTVILPHKLLPPDTTAVDAQPRFPLDWDAVFDYIGFPAFLKPHDGGGWSDVYRCNSPDEFFAAYD